jgi:hypothetical protein
LLKFKSWLLAEKSRSLLLRPSNKSAWQKVAPCRRRTFSLSLNPAYALNNFRREGLSQEFWKSGLKEFL